MPRLLNICQRGEISPNLVTLNISLFDPYLPMSVDVKLCGRSRQLHLKQCRELIKYNARVILNSRNDSLQMTLLDPSISLRSNLSAIMGTSPSKNTVPRLLTTFCCCNLVPKWCL